MNIFGYQGGHPTASSPKGRNLGEVSGPVVLQARNATPRNLAPSEVAGLGSRAALPKTLCPSANLENPLAQCRAAKLQTLAILPLHKPPNSKPQAFAGHSRETPPQLSFGLHNLVINLFLTKMTFWLQCVTAFWALEVSVHSFTEQPASPSPNFCSRQTSLNRPLTKRSATCLLNAGGCFKPEQFLMCWPCQAEAQTSPDQASCIMLHVFGVSRKYGRSGGV